MPGFSHHHKGTCTTPISCPLIAPCNQGCACSWQSVLREMNEPGKWPMLALEFTIGYLGSTFMGPNSQDVALMGHRLWMGIAPWPHWLCPVGKGVAEGGTEQEPWSHEAWDRGSVSQGLRVTQLLVTLEKGQEGYSLYPQDLNCDDKVDTRLPFSGGCIKSNGRKKRKSECMEHLCQAWLCAICFCSCDVI